MKKERERIIEEIMETVEDLPCVDLYKIRAYARVLKKIAVLGK